MQEEFKRVCQLLTSKTAENNTVALQILKGQLELAQKVEEYFQPILEASKKKSLKALPAVLEQLRIGKGTLPARMQIGTVVELYLSIETLHLNGQPLDKLPEWIKHLTNLKSLALSSCQLKEIPEWIGDLEHLTFLSIADNQIQELPDSIGNLTNLECCYIVGNKLKELPQSITQLSKLKNFYVKEGNFISKTELLKIKELLPNTSIW